jgi:hypothetical protein
VGVLDRDPGAELEVIVNGSSEVGIVAESDLVEGLLVELDEALTLCLADAKTTVHVDQVLEPEFATEAIWPSEGLSSERGEVIDVFGSARAEQRLQQVVGEDLRVEVLFQPMEDLLPSDELVQRRHAFDGTQSVATPRPPGCRHTR